jgi:hypothetical protein
MPLSNGDKVFEKVWPGNTTPVAVDGNGAVPESLCGFILQNTAAAFRYVRLFDKASAPNMGTDLAKLVIPLAAGQVLAFPALPRPPLFVNGLWVSVTTGQADNDSTAPTAGDVLLNLLYQ